MKKLRFLFIFSVFTLYGYQANSQSDTDSLGVPHNYEMYLETISQTCTAPESEVVSVVTTENNGGYVYLRFTISEAYDGSFQYRTLENLEKTNFELDGNEIILSNLPLNQDFIVEAQDACGDYVPVASFSTKKERNVEGIEVSNKLYGLITYYQSLPEPIPFPDFLQESDLHIVEKVSFMQSYYYKGTPIKDWDGNDWVSPPTPPPPPPVDPPFDGDDCICNFILNRSKNITPVDDDGAGGRKSDGSIYPTIAVSGHEPLPGASQSGTEWVAIESSKGPARYHQLWARASKAGGQNLSKLIDGTNGGNPSYTAAVNTALLRYNLFCQGIAYVPENCDCDKPLNLYFGYDSNVEALADTHNEGIGEKKSYAMGQDLAAGVFHVDGNNNFSVLRTIDVRHDAACNRQVNSNFWVNWGLVAARTVGLVYSLRDPNFTFLDSIAFSQSSSGFANALRTAASTSYWASNGCEENGSTTGSMSGDTLVYLEPNKPVTMYVFAYGRLEAGGKRSFESTARILSDFYLAGYLPGGPLNAQDLHCCSPKIADWLFASIPGAPASQATLGSRVSTLFNAFAPWNTAGNGSLLTEWGHDVVLVHPDCNIGNDEPGDPGGFSSGGDDRSMSISSFEIIRYTIFDQTGRLVWSGKNANTKQEMLNWLRSNEFGFATGVYFLNCISEKSSSTEKVFVH